MKANKFTINGEVKLDLTQDTVTENDVAEGKTFHKADGSEAVGVAQFGGGGGNADLRSLEVTNNGTYKASENLSSDKIVVNYYPNHPDFIDFNNFKCLRINTEIPALAVVNGTIDYSPLKTGWTCTLTSQGHTIPITPEMCEFQEMGALGAVVDNLPLVIFAPSNIEELLLSSNFPAEEVEFVLANYPPNTITLMDFSSIIGMEYEATFEYGTEVLDPCDGYSEIEVNVKPNLTSLSVTENGTYMMEKTYADTFTYNASTEHNVPEGSIGAFKLDVQLPELDLDTLDINTGNIDISNFAKDWAFSLDSGGDIISFSAEELPITLDNGVVIKLANREFPELRIASHTVAMFCPSNVEEYIRKLLKLTGEDVPEEQIQAMLSMFTPNTVFLFDLSNLSSDYEATFSYNPLPAKYDGYSSVKVEVPEIPTQEKTLTVIENGTNIVVPDDGYNISKVTVTTNIPIPEPVLVDLSVSENGTYTPDESIDGYSSVMVNIPSEGIMLNDGFEMSRVVVSKDITSIDNDFSSISRSNTVCIDYAGTLEEWEAIPKIDNWDAGRIDEVRCTDSNIQINGLALTYVYDSDTDTYYISDCPTNITEVVIPNTYLGKPVTLIAYQAFSGCNLLQNIIVPKSITKINKSAFTNCTSLESVKLPNTIAEILADAFKGCTNLKSINIPNGITTINSSVFADCTSLENIVIPDSVTSMTSSSFNNCGAKVLENGVYYVDKWIVDVDKTLSSFDFRETVVGIAGAAFSKASVTEIVIPEGVKYVGTAAFGSCANLTSITIPSSLIDLDASAFTGNNAITSVYISNIENWCKNNGYAFGFKDVLGYSLYLNNELVTNITLPDTITYISWYAFKGCESITNVTIPNSVTSIGGYAFYQCSGLTDINIFNGVTTIEQYAFYMCRNLKNVTLGENVPKIETYAFAYCSSLENIVIPDSVTSMAQYAFRACTSLKTATIGNGISIIDPSVFGECSSLESVTIGTGLTRINNGAFSRCEALKDIYYNGTTTQWNSIISNSGSSWSSDLSFTVHCTDGDISVGQ